MLSGSRKYQLAANREGQRNFVSRANTFGFNDASPGRSFGTTLTATAADATSSILEGIIQYKDVRTVRAIYRDIYFHDAIAGSAVDLKSKLPFSDFSLSSVNDENILKTYMESLESMHIKQLFPPLIVDQEVLGAFTGSLNFDDSKNYYTSVIPLNIDNCEFVETPVFGADPLINFKIPKELTDFVRIASEEINSGNYRSQYILNKLPKWILECTASGKALLDPLNVLYLARKTFSSASTGTSYFRRILPIYVFEKALLRGTINQAYRRQRAIGHITAGDEDWVPTNQELSNILQQFANADMDPVGAMVATRNGVVYQEVRQGNDLWKYDDIYDFSSMAKMRALGLNEQFLTGDANYSVVDVALSVFIEQLKSMRDSITQEMFYDKMFPIIAYKNGFLKKNHTVTSNVEDGSKEEYIWGRAGTSNIRRKNNMLIADYRGGLSSQLSMRDLDVTKYEIPSIQWHKQLQPKADQAYMDLLTGLTDKGLPIPLRMIAAAAGLDVDEVLDSLDDDINIQERISDYNKEKQKFSDDSEDQGSGGNFSFASLSDPLHRGKKNRNMDEARERFGVKGSIKRKKEVNERINRMAAQSLSRLMKNEVIKENNSYKERQKKKHYHKRG